MIRMRALSFHNLSCLPTTYSLALTLRVAVWHKNVLHSLIIASCSCIPIPYMACRRQGPR